MRKEINDILLALKKRGITQNEISGLLGLKQKNVNNLLNGTIQRLDYDTVISLQTYLGISAGNIDVCCMAGAGNPQLSTGEPVSSITLSPDYARPGIVPVMVKGSSMSPVINDGAIVGVDTEDREYTSGKYYAVWLDDQGAVIKKLSSEPGRIYVESLNKNEHSFYVSKESIQDHFILGRVAWWINRDF